MKQLRNITIGLALMIGAAVMAEVPDLPKRTVNGKEYYYYEVPKKETIYSITRKFGFTRDVIIQYNPQVRDGLRAGDTLLFPVDELEEVTAPEPAAAPIDTPIDEPEAEPVDAPAAEPAGEEDSPEAEIEQESEEQLQTECAEEAVAETEHAECVEVEPLNIAVMLPLMLESGHVTRQAENNTNFYRGMLLALEELAPTSGFKVNLTAYDTDGGSDVLSGLLSRPEMVDMDYIIAPNDTLAIERIAAVADSASAMVMNFFAVKDDAERMHESVLQANITREEMYERAAVAFCNEYASKKVVILNATDLPADKKEFVDLLTDKMVKSGIPYEQINYSGNFAVSRLAGLPMGDYVFVPTGASREILLRIIYPLTEYSASVTSGSTALFGYPEWVTVRGEVKNQLHKLNTVVYSRFSTALSCDKAKAVAQAYEKWYGTEMPQAVPNTVLLGYDAMSWLLYASSNGLTEPFDGAQNSFRVREIDGAGDVNCALYFLRYTPEGEIDAKVL